jgi:[acyl-carrier-protein] S-malonyltransferase
MKNPWHQPLAAAFAFRGYNLTNLGRTPELLEHPAYGPIVERHLRLAQMIHSECTHRSTDLVARVRERRESTIDTFSEDIALIIAVEMAQLELLDQFFGIDYREARLALGYSLGEITALVAGGVFVVEQVLPPLAAMADDCAALARDVTMGILFSRGAELPAATVHKMCVEITSEGNGVLAVSSYLAPNAMLLLGQGTTLDRFKQRVPTDLGGRINLRKVDGVWPPLHTPILWQNNITNRAGVMIQGMHGGLTTPSPAVLSLVTGKTSYTDYNSREMLVRWLDHPQRLWDGVCEILSQGIETVVHVGPDPNLVVATFKRLSDNVKAQETATFARWGKQAVSLLARRAWLTPILSSRAVLLRAPYVAQIILEDWLLEQEVK